MTVYLREGLLCLLWDWDSIGSTRNKKLMSGKNGIVNKMITKRKGKDYKTCFETCFPCFLPKPIWECRDNQGGRNQSYLTELPREFSLLFTSFIPIFWEEPWLFPKLMSQGRSRSKEHKDIPLLCVFSHFVFVYVVCCICSRRKSSREAKKDAVAKVTPL